MPDYTSVHEARGVAATPYLALRDAADLLKVMEKDNPDAVFKDAHVSKNIGDGCGWWVRLVENHGERDG